MTYALTRTSMALDGFTLLTLKELATKWHQIQGDPEEIKAFVTQRRPNYSLNIETDSIRLLPSGKS